MPRSSAPLLLLLPFAVLPAPAQKGRQHDRPATTTTATSNAGTTSTAGAANTAAAERRASAAFEVARQGGALTLHAFLERMPKGGDLHMHLSGAVYAETFLKDAAEDGLCVDPVHLAFTKSTTPEAERLTGPGKTALCPDGTLPATRAFTDQHLYDELVDSFSMRAFVPTPGTDGHDQFFSTFARFSGISHSHRGEWLDELATRAAAQNEQYLEIMETPTFTHAATLGYAAGWPGTPTPPVTDAATSTPPPDSGTSTAQLSALRDRLLAGGLRDEVAVDRREFADALADRRRREGCDTAAPRPACQVDIRFLYQVLRAFPPQQVFAQALLAFEVADAERTTAHPDVVGLNFVQPEDAYLAMSEYHRQMLMLAYLHSVYPGVHITLHAGELAPGLVPPAGLEDHIREAVELAHAERIGHGVDVMYERDPTQLLGELAATHRMIEINLTSNDVILGVTTNHHSLPAYLAAGVPVAFSTDDEGVSRIDLTHEYARAAIDFHLPYAGLKRSARTSLEHAFLPGPSLWAAPDDFSRAVGACAPGVPGAHPPSGACAAFLGGSPHAQAQWELERRFFAFEATF